MKDIALHILFVAFVSAALVMSGVVSVSPRVDEDVAGELADSLVNIGNRQMDALDTLYITRLRALPLSFVLPYNDKVRQYIGEYSAVPAPDRRRIMRRYEKYIPVIESVLAEYGVPEEFKIIPIIESRLEPDAVSYVTGATGLWQFTDGSAGHYGLVVNDDVDERMDLHKSSAAAARHLLDNCKAFDGDWLMALAAYNCGVGGARKAIARDKEKTGWWSIYPHFSRETKNYIASFVALVYLLNDLPVEEQR